MTLRRRYLAGLLALTAGCTGGGGSTATPTHEVVTTPPPTYPEIGQVAVVSRWDEYGDVEDQQTDTIPNGSFFAVAAQFDARTHDSEVTVEMQAEIRHDGSLVTRNSETVDTLTDESGVVDWEMFVGFYADEWDLGEHEAEVILQDETTGETSESTTVAFEVVEGEATETESK